MPSINSNRKGFTLIELIASMVLLVVLTGAATYLFRSMLLGGSGSEQRAGIGINFDRGIEDMVRVLRKASQVQSASNFNEIRFRESAETTNHSIFYLYNAADSYVPPPSFNQTSYQLKKAALSGGINGTFTYGSGEVIANDVLPPPTSSLSLSGNLITLDLSAKRGDETVYSRTQLRPRNL